MIDGGLIPTSTNFDQGLQINFLAAEDPCKITTIWRGTGNFAIVQLLFTTETLIYSTLSVLVLKTAWNFKMSVETITTISPTTNKPILTRNGISAFDLDALPTIATEAFLSFRKTTLAERRAIVKKALKLLNDKQDELAKELAEQMGRPIAYGAKEITTAVKRGEYLVKISEDALKDTDGEAEKGFKRFIRKVPVGPVLVLFAWNVSVPGLGRAILITHTMYNS